jgi:Rad3-related DNA helicase
MMSATILDKDAFCASLGLAPEEVKFIQVPSDFPLHNRPIYPLNIAYLNSDSLKLQEVQVKIARAIDNLMTFHHSLRHQYHNWQIHFFLVGIHTYTNFRLSRVLLN